MEEPFFRIKRISVKNYRSLVDFSVDISEKADCVVFAGQNGSGKTSVLECCLLALARYPLLEPRTPPFDQKYSIELVLDRQSEEIPLSTDWRQGKNDYDAYLSETQIGKPISIDKVERVPQWRSSVEPPPRVLYLSSWRVPGTLRPIRLNVNEPRSPEARHPDVLARVKRQLVDLQANSAFEPQDFTGFTAKKAFEDLNNAWRSFFPETHLKFRANKRIVDGESRYDVILAADASDPGISVDRLSSGEIELFCMLGMLLTDSGYYDFVFLDEPELHLNESWHRTLLPVLKRCSPKTMFVVATHSEGIWNSVRSFERHFIRMPEKGE